MAKKVEQDESQLVFVNGAVPVAPFERVAIEVKRGSGFTKIENKNILVSSRAVFESSFKDKTGADVVVPAGTEIFVRGEVVTNHQFATSVFNMDGVEPFVLIPSEFIIALKA